MCGICGKVNFDRDARLEPGLLRHMTDTIRHRGPDGTGLHLSGAAGLGHTRLSIIDLSTGDQPMSNEDNSIWVVFNGEIYNFAELRQQLQALGHTFKSRSDTEVIVHAYEEWGQGGVSRLKGMFAFAIWDERKELLLLARDRVGIKPLYYVDTGKALVFGSEVKALLADRTVPRTLNAAAVDRFLTFGYLPGHETLLQGVHKLQPGHLLTLQNGITRTTQVLGPHLFPRGWAA